MRTGGISDHPMHVPEGHKDARYCELVTYLPADWDLDLDGEESANSWPGALLRLLGEFVHENSTWFEAGHTVLVSDEGETYAPGTLVSAVLLRAPEFGPAGFDELTIDGRRCRFHWAFPITRAECDHKLEHGPESLESLIAAQGLPEVLDPGRRCLVTGRGP